MHVSCPFYFIYRNVTVDLFSNKSQLLAEYILMDGGVFVKSTHFTLPLLQSALAVMTLQHVHVCACMLEHLFVYACVRV